MALDLTTVRMSFNYLCYSILGCVKIIAQWILFLYFMKFSMVCWKHCVNFFHRPISIFDKENYYSCNQTKADKAFLFALTYIAFVNLVMLGEIHLFIHNIKGAASSLSKTDLPLEDHSSVISNMFSLDCMWFLLQSWKY